MLGTILSTSNSRLRKGGLKISLGGCAFGAMAFTAGGTAQAASLSNTYTFDAVTVDPSTASIARNFSADATQFNPSLGTLNSIETIWSVTGTMTGSFSSSSGVSFSGGGSVELDGNAYQGFGLGNGTVGSAGQSFSITDTAGNDDTLLSGVNVSPTAFADAIGANTVPYSYDFAGSDNGDSPDNWQFTSSGSLTVIYNYDATAIPEPASIGLIGVPAVMGLLRRRRKQV